MSDYQLNARADEDDETARSQDEQDEQDRQDEAEGGYTEDDHFGDNDPEERQLEFDD